MDKKQVPELINYIRKETGVDPLYIIERGSCVRGYAHSNSDHDLLFLYDDKMYGQNIFNLQHDENKWSIVGHSIRWFSKIKMTEHWNIFGFLAGEPLYSNGLTVSYSVEEIRNILFYGIQKHWRMIESFTDIFERKGLVDHTLWVKYFHAIVMIEMINQIDQTNDYPSPDYNDHFATMTIGKELQQLRQDLNHDSSLPIKRNADWNNHIKQFISSQAKEVVL